MTDEEYIKNIDKIETDKLFENLKYYGFDGYYRDLWYATINELKKRIRPQGERIKNTDKLGLSYICPFCCHEITGIPQDLNYCCKCGADMKGGAE